MTDAPASKRAKDRESRAKERILDAAIECFIEAGTQRSSMTDIAKAAGVSRKTLYRVFEDRPALIEAILHKRIIAMGDRVRKRLTRYTSIEDALIEGSVTSIAAGRNDKLFNEIVQKESNHRIEQFLLRGNKQILKEMLGHWSPVIDEGRRQGKVREDLSNARIVEIIVSIHALLLMLDNYGPKKQRAYLKDVLVPAVTCSRLD